MFILRKRFLPILLASSLFAACGSSEPVGTGDPNDGDIPMTCLGGTQTALNPPAPGVGPNVVFTAVGDNIASGLIDMEFLPGRNGESLVITKDGAVYYLKRDFTLVPASETIATRQDGSERGLLNVAADPLYTENCYVYFYYTVPGSSPDVNRIERYSVRSDPDAGEFALTNPQVIMEFPKSSGATNHNGGSMVFMDQDHLAAGVGEGNVPDSAQDKDSPLGKLHRFVPNRDFNAGGLDPAFSGNGVSTVTPSVYSLGLRNPFTLVLDNEGDLFVGDVGAGTYEEINCVYYAGENYLWPTCEGPCVLLDPINPIHGYAHTAGTAFDPDFDSGGGGKTIIVSAYYRGNQYGGLFTDRIIYNDFYDGFVRLLTMDQNERVISDQHIGNQPFLLGLQTNPADGLLYGVSLSGNERVLRMDLEP
ncbi:MAG TPA: hypothetical protein DF383_00185 [Deltaproteobacteria bacterium]|nr:hypothetical protein [Deltaproteobacteria bacterium]